MTDDRRGRGFLGDRAAYYDNEITIDQLTVLVGAEAAANLWVLKQQLDEDFINEVADVCLPQRRTR